MIESKNKKDGEESHEEEKISTSTRRKIINQENQIRDARSMSRNEFTKIKLVDPRIARQEIPQKRAEERRKKLIKDNRAERIEQSKKKEEVTETNDSRQVSKLIKELNQALNNYMSITAKEIENIKRMIDLNHSEIKEGNKKTETNKREIDSKMQNIINAHKEIAGKHEALESLVVWMTEKIQEYKTPVNSKYKQKSGKDNIHRDKTKFNKQEFLTAILHDKKRYDNGIMVMNDGSRMYKKKIWCKWIWKRGNWNTHYYVYDNKKLIDLKKFYEIYRENMIFGRQSIVEALEEIKKSKRRVSRNKKNTKIDGRMDTDSTKEKRQ